MGKDTREYGELVRSRKVREYIRIEREGNGKTADSDEERGISADS